MATAKLIVPEPVPHKVILELSIDEAEVLHFIMRRVGGDPCVLGRRETEAVRRALLHAEVWEANLKTQSGLATIYLLPGE